MVVTELVAFSAGACSRSTYGAVERRGQCHLAGMTEIMAANRQQYRMIAEGSTASQSLGNGVSEDNETSRAAKPDSCAAVGDTLHIQLCCRECEDCSSASSIEKQPRFFTKGLSLRCGRIWARDSITCFRLRIFRGSSSVTEPFQITRDPNSSLNNMIRSSLQSSC